MEASEAAMTSRGSSQWRHRFVSRSERCHGGVGVGGGGGVGVGSGAMPGGVVLTWSGFLVDPFRTDRGVKNSRCSVDIVNVNNSA